MAEFAGRQHEARERAGARSGEVATPGKQTEVERVYGTAVQRQAVGAADEATIHGAAARGIATPASPMPHGATIQRLFGRHDVSSVQAHAGPDAAVSASAMSAAAYAAGNHIVLGEGADLFTVAHEAAHVVQQRGGVQLRGGVGAVGDAYERHADEVASLVVRGESAEPVLDRMAGGSTRAASPMPAIQRKVGPDPGGAFTVNEAWATWFQAMTADEVRAQATALRVSRTQLERLNGLLSAAGTPIQIPADDDAASGSAGPAAPLAQAGAPPVAGADGSRDAVALRLQHRIAMATEVIATVGKLREFVVVNEDDNPNLSVRFQFAGFEQIRDQNARKLAVSALRVMLTALIGVDAARRGWAVAPSMRQSFGFPETSLSDTGPSIRISPGSEPIQFAAAIAAGIQRLDAEVTRLRTSLAPAEYLRHLGVYVGPEQAIDRSRVPLNGIARGKKSTRALDLAINNFGGDARSPLRETLDDLAPAGYKGGTKRKHEDSDDDEGDHDADTGSAAAQHRTLRSIYEAALRPGSHDGASASASGWQSAASLMPPLPVPVPASAPPPPAAAASAAAASAPRAPSRAQAATVLPMADDIRAVVHALAADERGLDAAADASQRASILLTSATLALNHSHVASMDPSREPPGPLGQRAVHPFDQRNSQFYNRSNIAGAARSTSPARADSPEMAPPDRSTRRTGDARYRSPAAP